MLSVEFFHSLFVDLLYILFIKTSAWKTETLVEDRVDSGVYVLYNRISLAAYVRESSHIQKRFFEHYDQLSNNSHFNKGLQNSVTEHGIKAISFFVYDYGTPYRDRDFRKNAEIDLMNSWPGPIYNIKAVHKKTKLT